VSGSVLAGRRILVVEDELLVAMLAETLLAEAGCQIIGPIGRLSSAIKAAEEEQIDAAVLDVNLNGEPVFACAEILSRRGIPFLFVSGYGASGLPASFKDRPILTKPYRSAALLALLASLGSQA
jgi:CheY-like chemotaxis protein